MKFPALAAVLLAGLAGPPPAPAQPARPQRAKLVHQFAPDSADSGVAFSPDGRLLMLHSGIDGVRLYDPVGWKKLRSFGLDVGERPVTSAAFHPNSKTVATGNAFGRVHLWDVATGRVVAGPWEAPPKGAPATDVWGLAFTPDGKALVVNGWHLCDPETGAVTRALRGSGRQPRLSPDGKLLAGVVGGAVAEVWDLGTGRSVGQVTHPGAPRVQGLAVSPDGKSLATAGADLAVRLWELPGLRPAGVLEPVGVRDGLLKGAGPVAFRPDGKVLAVGDGEGFVHLWDLAARREVGLWEAYRFQVRGLAWSPDGAVVVTSGGGGVKVWAPPEPGK